MAFDVNKIREDFPILKRKVNGCPLVYLDNASTTQKPNQVIDAITDYYRNHNANIHRAVYALAEESTEAYESARDKIAKFVNIKNRQELIFVRGTTEAINLVAYAWGRSHINEGDIIVTTEYEHHSNIVPWQLIAQKKNLSLKVIPIHENGELNMASFDELLSEKTKLISITHISNTLGTINPIKEIIKKAHIFGAKVLIDGAQSIQHGEINVSELDCDFFVFSGHKIFGPTGIGVLYGKEALLESMPPYQGGGDMIKRVSFDHTSFNELPFKFEAGTPNIIGGIALGTAIKFLKSIDTEQAFSYEKALLNYAEQELKKIDEMTIIGTATEKTSLVSFNVGQIHPFDIGTLLDKQGIAVRTGHHCTQPLMDFFKIPGTLRASFAFYNTIEEVDVFIAALKRSLSLLK